MCNECETAGCGVLPIPVERGDGVDAEARVAPRYCSEMDVRWVDPRHPIEARKERNEHIGDPEVDDCDQGQRMWSGD